MTGRARIAAVLAAAILLSGSGCTAVTAPADAACSGPACRPASTAASSRTSCPAAGRGLPAPHRAARPTVGGKQVHLATSTYTFSDFHPVPGTQRIGLLIPPTVGSFTGAGISSTALEMAPRTSTAAGTIPVRFPDSNRLSLLRAAGASVRLSDFTLLGTDQGHPYNGLRVERSSGARISDICVAGIPGTGRQPPGETFGISDNLTTGSVYRDVEVDGRGVGAAGLGVSVSSDVTVVASRFVRNRYSSGATFWEVRDIDLRDVTATDNGVAGLNFERVSGTVRIARPVVHGNGEADIRIASDEASARFIITDPVTGDHGRLTVELPPTYYGRPNLQRAADIRLLSGGKDRTADLVRFIRH